MIITEFKRVIMLEKESLNKHIYALEQAHDYIKG